MVKRLILVGFMVLLQGNVRQIFIATFMAGAFLLFQVQASPFRDKFDDYLASTASFSLLIIFLCAIAFKYDELTSLEEVG